MIKRLVSSLLIFSMLASAGWRGRRMPPPRPRYGYTRSRHISASEAVAIALAAGIGGYAIAKSTEHEATPPPPPTASPSVPLVLDPSCEIVVVDGKNRVMCLDEHGHRVIK